jgi:hypothetical protein
MRSRSAMALPPVTQAREIERLALADRAELGLAFGEPCDPRRLAPRYDAVPVVEIWEEWETFLHVQRLEARVLPRGLDASRVLLRGLDAWSGALLRIPEDGGALLVNPKHARMKRTLTIARELGHAALGHQAHTLVEPDAPLGVFTATDPAGGVRAVEEEAANAYALALLAPYAPLLQLLEQGLSLAQITAHFGVSVSALTQRLRLAGVTT